jgi:perosamine synthetase
MAATNHQRMQFISHSRPTLGAQESELLTRVIESGHIGEGPFLTRFENAFASRIGVKYAVGVSSGTAALHLTLLALGIGPDDEVILPSYVCTALLNAINYVGAVPVIADIQPQTYNIDPDDADRKKTARTKAIIVPHLFGLAADMKALKKIGFPVIEDGAQAVGAKLEGRPVGALGHAAVFSFYATKVMTTGEGGLVASDSKALIDRISDLKTYDNRKTYSVRYNYKMSDIHAAVGLIQLKRLDSFIQRRQAIAKKYQQAFKGLGLGLPADDPNHIYFRYVIDAKTDPTAWIEALIGKGIGCARPIYKPLHCYLGRAGYPQTEKAWRHALSLPIYPSLREKDTDWVIRQFIHTCRKFK